MERVYVGNLPPDIRIKDIDDFFRPFGKLVYIDVNHRTNPVYAYVQFDSARNAFNAVKSRHGYDYEGYTLQLRLVENEVRKRRDATPPPPPPPMLSEFGSQNNRGGYNNDFGNNFNNRMGGNFPNSSFQSGSSSQWSGNNRSNMSQQQQQNMSQYPANNRVNAPQQTMMDYQQQNMMPYSSNGRSNVQQNPKSNRSNMQQNNNSNRSNMPQNMNSNRSNMQQNNSNRSNMQQNMNSNRSNMQQNTNSNRLNVQQQYSNSNRSNMQNMNNYSNMSQQNNNNNYSNNSQQNMNNYSNANRSNMSQQQQNMNMMNYSNNNNNSSWNSGNDNMGWNSGNNIGGGNNYNNAAPNNMYNPNNDPYATAGFEDSFTHGLSGSGRKWFNRYIRKGFSPEIARSKALEHRTVPYLREDPTPVNPIPDDPTNIALETIGNTLLSLLSTNPGDNFNNENQMMQSFSNWGGDNFQAGNFDMPGPSSSRGRGNMVPQSPAVGGQPRNRVSKQQYLKSVDILKKLRGKSVNAKDRLSRKYHTQIVKDYEEFEKSSSANNRGTRTLSNPRNDRQIASKAADGKTYSQLSIALRKKKQQLFLAARRMRMEPKQRYGGAYKKRMKILMNDCGFSDLEAKALAVHPMEKLVDLIALKADYDNASKKKPTSVSLTKPVGNKTMKSAAYRNDVNYIRMYEKQKLDSLSPRIKSAIRACLVRIHKHEKEAKLPLTKSKFTKLLPSKTDQKPKTTTTATQKKQDENKKTTTTTTKKTVVENKPKVAATNTKKVAEKKDKEPPTTTKGEQNAKEDAAAVEEPHKNEETNEDIKEEQHEEECEDAAEDVAENAEEHEE